eukprot:Amastigsp_a687346_3.p2 type:complete len:157 gc:universal Amastigsp_a687346_3:478-8(-)
MRGGRCVCTLHMAGPGRAAFDVASPSWIQRGCKQVGSVKRRRVCLPSASTARYAYDGLLDLSSRACAVCAMHAFFARTCERPMAPFFGVRSIGSDGERRACRRRGHEAAREREYALGLEMQFVARERAALASSSLLEPRNDCWAPRALRAATRGSS